MAVECTPQAGYARRMGEDAPTPDHAGHRSRLRARLLDDVDGLADYELVEYLLALAIPRRDTKPLAKALLREFGGIAGLFAADNDALRRMKGMGDTSIAALRAVGAASVRLAKAEVAAKPVLANWQALLDYLRGRDDARLIGPDRPEGRVPTVALQLARPGAEAAAALAAHGIMASGGDFYAVRPLRALGIDPAHGVLRLSFVHYTSEDEVDQLIRALDAVL